MEKTIMDLLGKVLENDVLLSILGVVVGILVFAFCFFINITIFYFLWNWLVPDLFGLSKLTYLQASGLFLLARGIFSKGYEK